MSANPFEGVGYGPSEEPDADLVDAGPTGTAVFAGDIADDMPDAVRRAIAEDEQRIRSQPDHDDTPAEPSAPAGVADGAADDGATDDDTDDSQSPVPDPDEGESTDGDGDTDPELSEPDPVASGLRRMRVIGATAAVTGLLALVTMFAPFYHADVPAQTLRLRDGRQVELNAAEVTVTAWGLTHQQAPSSGPGVARATSTAERPAAVAGIPRTHAMLAVMAMFAAAGFVLRLTLPTGFSVIAGTFAFKQLTAMRGIVEHVRAGGEFITPQWGLTIYSLLLALTMSLLLSLTVQTFVVNLRERQAIREEAEARGVAAPATVFATIAGLIGRQLARFMEAGRDADGDAVAAD